MWRAGQNIGGYELLAKLRDGGMATLFLARRRGPAGFARHVAIKVIHQALANDEQFRQMFLDEALLSGRIQHPNVVRVEELGQHGAMPFLVMEFVHGCSLAQLQRTLLERGRRLSPAFAVRIAMHVADALHAAHEARDERGRLLNVVHRDVSPENVLLAYAGQVKLIDFGIARAHGRRHRTQDGLLKGKFRYMAPEQALGRPVDRRVDVYQLGIVLWEMLTLRRMFDAERDVDLLAAVQRPRVAPPSAWVDGIPPALDVALMRALDPDPKSRPIDAQSFARLLARAQPEAHEVDGHALHMLLRGCMQEHREREREMYPNGVYEGLERQCAAAVGAAAPAPSSPPAPAPEPRASTLRAPEPRPMWCADTPTRPGPGAVRRGSSLSSRAEPPRRAAPVLAPEVRSLAAATVPAIEARSAPRTIETRSAPRAVEAPAPRCIEERAASAPSTPLDPVEIAVRGAQPRGSIPPAARPRRQRRWVQVAEPLRTLVTQALEVRSPLQSYWLGIGASIGVAGALALLTIALRGRPHHVPSLPVLPTVSDSSEPIADDIDAGLRSP